MDFQPNDNFLKKELTMRLKRLEKYLSADVMSYTGAIHETWAPKLRHVIESLAKDKNKKGFTLHYFNYNRWKCSCCRFICKYLFGIIIK